jgi:hypothetical protein
MADAQYRGTMRPMLAAILVAATVAATGTVASAGTYLGLGIGTAASPGGDIAMTSSDGNRSGRLVLGTRFGHLSVEGAGSRYGLFRGNTPYDGTQMAVALKYSLPLGNNFEAYGRGGLERTWLSTDTSAADFAGNGWLLGGGFEYRMNLGVTAASVFVDYEHSDTDLVNQTSMQSHKDETIGLWTVGLTLAI